MIKKLFLTLLFSNLIITTNAQLIKGKVLSKNTLKSIEGIAIVTNLKNGTTTNSKGVFTRDISNVAKITFTNLNYETLVLSQKNFTAKNYTVYLEEKVNELAEIKLNLKKNIFRFYNSKDINKYEKQLRKRGLLPVIFMLERIV